MQRLDDGKVDVLLERFVAGAAGIGAVYGFHGYVESFFHDVTRMTKLILSDADRLFSFVHHIEKTFYHRPGPALDLVALLRELCCGRGVAGPGPRPQIG